MKTPLTSEPSGRRFQWCFQLVDGGGFEPPKSSTADLQSAPFGRSGTHPNIFVNSKAYLMKYTITDIFLSIDFINKIYFIKIFFTVYLE